ncbi:hypothetical protein JCM30760_08110 [Thiomicrorhabdus hydrogeniphila]
MRTLYIIVVTSLFLSGCASNSFLTKVKNKTLVVAETIGLIEEDTMKKPDYYSTSQLKNDYEYGKDYDLNKMSCSESGQCK